MRRVANRMQRADERPFENARIHTSESLSTTTRMLQQLRRISHRTRRSRAYASSSLICDVESMDEVVTASIRATLRSQRRNRGEFMAFS